MIACLVDDDVDTVMTWSIQGCYQELFEYIKSMAGYETLSDDELQAQYEARLED
jgi:hypothetical protein